MATAKQPAAKQPANKPSEQSAKQSSRGAAAKPGGPATKAAAQAPAAKRAGGSASKPSGKSLDDTPHKAAATKPSAPTTKATTNPTMSTATRTSSGAAEPAFELPKPKFNKDGLGYTKDFDLAFVKEQYDALQAERVRLTGQALRLEAEAHQLVEEAEMGDVKFDDEGGEGDTTSVERERDLALSAQAREAIDEIDAALIRITNGTYGYSVVSGRPIPRERLEAIPWSSVLVEEKVGGIGRR